VDTFLLSCRILGRGVEEAVWPVLGAALADRGCTELRASYLPTAKNAQVRDYWDRIGFERVGEDAGGGRSYSRALPDPAATAPTYVEVIRAW
jgi:predicted enzyme involved in methoxymalonyl-ACP biosynthesis